MAPDKARDCISLCSCPPTENKETVPVVTFAIPIEPQTSPVLPRSTGPVRIHDVKSRSGIGEARKTLIK